MDFKKQILLEELGLGSNGRKTFTKNKRQNVILSEKQLERLMSLIESKNEVDEHHWGKKATYTDYPQYDMAAYRTMNEAEMCEGEMCEEEQMDEGGNKFSGERCKAGCKGGEGTEFTVDGKKHKVTDWSEDDKKACGCKDVKESYIRKLKTTKPITESEVDKISEYMNRLGNTRRPYNPSI